MFKIINFTLSLILITSCSSIKPIAAKKIEKKTKQVLVKKISEVIVRPGKVKYVEFDINLEDGKWLINCKGIDTAIIVEKKKARLFMSENYFSDLKPFFCTYKDNIDKKKVLFVKVKSFPYKSEKLNVDKKRIDISKKNLERHWREKAILKKVYKSSASYFLFDKPFKKPLASFVTSHYGNRRVFNNKKKTQHFGNDLRAAVGKPIPVSNKGKVVFIGDLFFSGNVVIVDHGLNIFTTYGHLSKIEVTVGMVLNQGEIVGLAGATGRVSGPHLHWGVKINGNWVDGFSLIDESRKAAWHELH